MSVLEQLLIIISIFTPFFMTIIPFFGIALAEMSYIYDELMKRYDARKKRKEELSHHEAFIDAFFD